MQAVGGVLRLVAEHEAQQALSAHRNAVRKHCRLVVDGHRPVAAHRDRLLRLDSRQVGVAHVGGTEAGDATRRRIGQLLPVIGDLVAPGVGDVDDLVAVAEHDEVILVRSEAHQRRGGAAAVLGAVAVREAPGAIGFVDTQPFAIPDHLVVVVARGQVDAVVVVDTRAGAHPAEAGVAVVLGFRCAIGRSIFCAAPDLDRPVLAEVALQEHHPTVIRGHHEPTVEGDVDADEEAFDVIGLVPPISFDNGRGRVGRIAVDIGDGVILATEEEGVVAVDQGVHAVEAGHVLQRESDGVFDRLPALLFVEASKVVLEFGLRRLPLATLDHMLGQDLERVVVELVDRLTTIAPDHPTAVGVRARDHATEVARGEPGVLHAVGIEDFGRPFRSGPRHIVLLVAPAVGHGVARRGEEGIDRRLLHHDPFRRRRVRRRNRPGGQLDGR